MSTLESEERGRQPICFTLPPRSGGMKASDVDSAMCHQICRGCNEGFGNTHMDLYILPYPHGIRKQDAMGAPMGTPMVAPMVAPMSAPLSDDLGLSDDKAPVGPATSMLLIIPHCNLKYQCRHAALRWLEEYVEGLN